MDNLVKVHGSGGYDSDFSDEDAQGESSERGHKRKREEEILQKPFQKGRSSKVAHRSLHSSEVDREEAMNRRAHLISMNAFERHKKFVGDYILYYGGQMDDFRRSRDKDKTDADVLRENHRFLWRDEDEEDMTWEKELAKKYYDKLFKEYCITDLSRYKENKFGFRWRTENEVVSGKGQFQCGNKRCEKEEGLKSWEVNFAYVEQGEKRNALVKLRLCPECSFKLNYHHKRKEVIAKKKTKRLSVENQEPPTKKKTKKRRRSSSHSKKHKHRKHRERSASSSSSEGSQNSDKGDVHKSPTHKHSHSHSQTHTHSWQVTTSSSRPGDRDTPSNSFWSENNPAVTPLRIRPTRVCFFSAVFFFSLHSSLCPSLKSGVK